MPCSRTSGTGSSRCGGGCAACGTRGAARRTGRSSRAWASATTWRRRVADVGVPRILVVDDDATLARLVLHLVRSRGFGEGVHVTSGRQALESLEGTDIVLLDHQLPDASGLDLLAAIRARPNPPAVIMITAHGNESLAVAALRLGAAERDLIRAERFAAIGEMTVALHHGINNPLMSASADVELLLAESGMAEPLRRRCLEGIQASLHRIRDIVRQIGDLRAVRTRPYLPGIQMVDLSGEGHADPGARHGTALVLVADEDLARIVALLLRHAGFQVQRCVSLDDLRRQTGQLGVSLVLVLGGTDAAGAHPLGGFDPPAGRDYRVVAL